LSSDLRGVDLEAAVREQVAYFASIGHDLEWKVFAHDTPAELADSLVALGFIAEPEETIVYLDLSATSVNAVQPSGFDVEKIVRPDAVDEITEMLNSVWQEDASELTLALKAQLREDARHLGIYVARVDGALASVGWIRLHDAGSFASLWGGTTVPDFRKRGLYSALVAARASEASRHGARYLTVDARPTSQPILEKLGFRPLTRARGFVWSNPNKKTT
jgi:GNAT superfamily N-acetyltransferase